MSHVGTQGNHGMAIKSPFTTVSEELFAEYLDAAKYPWEYEEPVEGQTKKPDFRIRHGGVELLCDVKQRNPSEMPKGGGNANPVRHVREILRRAIKQFKGFDEHLCAAVLYNHGDWETSLEPFIIYGAMLGQPGFSMNLDAETGTLDPDTAQNVFMARGGKMIKHYEPLEVYETPRNISAVIALERHSPDNPVFKQAQAEEESRQSSSLGRALTDEEGCAIGWDLIQQGLQSRLPERQRVIVCLNPFARQSFSEHLFKGDYDERWAITDGSMQRVWAGAKCESFEDDDANGDDE